MAKARNIGSGWHKESLRHSQARKTGRAGGIYKVLGVAINRKTGEYIGKPRTEKINVQTNDIFRGAKDKKDVKLAYESFWNMNKRSPEKVKVLDVQKEGDKHYKDI
jgi:hypothetical protein